MTIVFWISVLILAGNLVVFGFFLLSKERKQVDPDKIVETTIIFLCCGALLMTYLGWGEAIDSVKAWFD